MSASCEKPVEEPVFTQGFSCKIDGVEWVAKTPASISGPVALDPFFNESTGSMHLKATKKNNDLNIHEFINIYGLISTSEASNSKMIVFDADGEEHNGYLSLIGNTQCNSYFHDSLNPGNLEVCLFDKDKREISGTFNMTLINRDCSDSLMHITDGEFAFRY